MPACFHVTLSFFWFFTTASMEIVISKGVPLKGTANGLHLHILNILNSVTDLFANSHRQHLEDLEWLR